VSVVVGELYLGLIHVSCVTSHFSYCTVKSNVSTVKCAVKSNVSTVKSTNSMTLPGRDNMVLTMVLQII